MGDSIMITLSCQGITCMHSVDLPLPPGWTGDTEIEHGLYCSDEACQAQQRWFDAVCPGCVEGYPGCNFFKAFAYSGRRRTITIQHLDHVAQGHCPYRTNGTLGLTITPTSQTIEALDLSSRACPDDSIAVRQAVEAYMRMFP